MFAIGVFTPLDFGKPVTEAQEEVRLLGLNFESFCSGEWAKSFELYLGRHVSFRSFLIRKRNEFMYSFFKSSPRPEVLLGNDFSLHFLDYLQVLFPGPFSYDSLTIWKNDLKDFNSRLKNADTQMILFLAPSSEDFRTDTLPWINIPRNLIRRTDQLKSLGPLSNIQIVNGRAEFQKLENPRGLFFNYDYHWNNRGGFKGAQMIYNQIAKAEGLNVVLSEDDYDFIPYKKGRSFVTELLALDDLLFETNWKSVPRQSSKMQKRLPVSVLIVGDSFVQAIGANLKGRFFQQKYQSKINLDFDMDLVAKQHWDYVIFVATELKLQYFPNGKMFSSLDSLLKN